MTRRTLEELSREECYELARTAQVGRLVYTDENGPAAVPVNYVLAGESIVFRSGPGDKLTNLQDQRVAFEVDDIDKTGESGWSVLIRGTGESVDMDHVIELLHRIDGEPPVPWAKSIHNNWVVITPTAVTGRRLADLVYEDFF